ncbi:hypothetical protein CBS147354_7015 [Penicillium roqueforti]|nr:hypothetical protein CBS147354_7015 [Penicillium roqueforti]
MRYSISNFPLISSYINKRSFEVGRSLEAIVVYSFLRLKTMRCLWRFPSWPKRQKSEDDEGQLPLETLDGVALLQSQSAQSSRLNGAQDTRSTSGFQERYVRIGIGGAGNLRKSCFPFLRANRLSKSFAIMAEK